MDIWQRARTFAEETAKRSQELTKEAAKRSQEFTIGSSKISDIVSEASKRSKEIAVEASKRSKEIAVEASKRADQIKAEALKRADQIKSQIPLSNLVESSSSASVRTALPALALADLEMFGITKELREFIKEITISTFQEFPLEDDSEMSNVPTVSNVSQDLTEWQENHAKLVLSTVKEISKLRYELCPRVMKERKFWRIYFILVNSHVAPYEKRYMEAAKLRSAEKVKDDVVKENTSDGTTLTTEMGAKNQKSKSTASLTSEQDLDVFLLGDIGDSEEEKDGANDDLDDDFDTI